MRSLVIAAAVLLTVGTAFAADKPHQNNPSAIPEVHTGASQTSGVAPQGANPEHPQPGEGYRMPTGPSTTAPAEPTDTTGKYKGKREGGQ